MLMPYIYIWYYQLFSCQKLLLVLRNILIFICFTYQHCLFQPLLGMQPTDKDIPAPPFVTESASFAVPVINKPFHSVSMLVKIFP